MITLIAFGAYSIFFLIVTIFLVLLFLTIIDTARGNAPFVPIRSRVIPEVEKLFVEHAPITDTSVMIDPGCGDGKVLTYFAKKYPAARFVGIEINWLPYFIAKFSSRTLNNVSIVRRDIFKYDYSHATHIFTYLFPELIDPLYTRITDQASRPLAIVTCDFASKKLSPAVTVDLTSAKRDLGLAKRLYLYLLK